LQVSLEGGRDAAFEASAAYDAIAVLEARARAWHERRQRAILEAANPNLLESLLPAEEAGRRGAEAIREVRRHGFMYFMCTTVELQIRIAKFDPEIKQGRLRAPRLMLPLCRLGQLLRPSLPMRSRSRLPQRPSSESSLA
jgi:hypothetical protein